MFSPRKSYAVTDSLVLIEPPAGLLTYISKRLKELSDADDKMSTAEWFAVYVLACLHCDGASVAVRYSMQFQHGYSTLREVFCDSTQEEFKEVVNELVFNIGLEELESMFNIVDSNNYITKKSKAALKNDSPPDQTTGS